MLMKKIALFMISISICLIMVGCKDSENGYSEGSELKEEHVYDIYFIKKAPKTTEQQPLSKVIKLTLTQNDSSLGNTIAMDIENNIIYIDTWMSTISINYQDEYKRIEDKDKSVDIREK